MYVSSDNSPWLPICPARITSVIGETWKVGLLAHSGTPSAKHNCQHVVDSKISIPQGMSDTLYDMAAPRLPL